jgi:hypothetical protein
MDYQEFTITTTGSFICQLTKRFPPSDALPCNHPDFLSHVIGPNPHFDNHVVEAAEYDLIDAKCVFYGQIPCGKPESTKTLVFMNDNLDLGTNDPFSEVLPVCDRHENLMVYMMSNLAAWKEGKEHDPDFSAELAPTFDV